MALACASIRLAAVGDACAQSSPHTRVRAFARLQDRCGVTLKLGVPDDFFPGTCYRAALVRGPPRSLESSIDVMVDVLWRVRCGVNAYQL